MKKWIVGALVGAVILFAWQFIAWGVSSLHQSFYGYTPQEDTILSVLSANIKTDGHYTLPGLEPGKSQEESEKKWMAHEGKPWAVVEYHSAMKTDMTMNLVRGFVNDILVVLLLIWIFGKMNSISVGSGLTTGIGLGVVMWCLTTYMNQIWFQTAGDVARSMLIDDVVSLALVGTWLGFWLKRN